MYGLYVKLNRFLIFSLVLFCLQVHAQDNNLMKAREAIAKKDFEGFVNAFNGIDKNEKNLKILSYYVNQELDNCDVDAIWESSKKVVSLVSLAGGVACLKSLIAAGYYAFRGHESKLIDLNTASVNDVKYSKSDLFLSCFFLKLAIDGWHGSSKEDRKLKFDKQMLHAIEDLIWAAGPVA